MQEADMATRTRKSPDNQLDFHLILGGQDNSTPKEKVNAVEDGSLDFDQRLKRALNIIVKKSAYSREQIAEMMTAVTGRPVTKTTIDSWTGAARPNQFPAHLIPAFCVVTGSTELLELLAEPCGVRTMQTREAQLAKLGRMWLVIHHARQEQEKLISEMPIFSGRVS
jgi:hypothetical protein